MTGQGDDPGLVGRRIVDMRPMTRAEAAAEGWDLGRLHGAPTVLVLDDGTLVYPSRDPEGNGPGALFGAQGGQQVAFTCREVAPGGPGEPGAAGRAE